MPSALLVVVKNGLLLPGTGALLALYAECLLVPGADSFLESGVASLITVASRCCCAFSRRIAEV